MSPQKYFLDIPVYRCSPNKHKKELAADRQAHIENAILDGADPMWAEASFDSQHAIPWRYNQVIGYLRLYTTQRRDTIKAEFWRIEQRRISRQQGKKVFKLRRGDALGFWIDGLSSQEIYKAILEHLKKLNKDRRFRNRYIDLEVLKTMGPFVDWQGLIHS
jgi:hypothetical protein